MINIDRALTIPGWMGDEELHWLAEHASARHVKHVAEIGCWMGRTTVALAENCPNGTIYAVDTWEGSEEHVNELKDKPKRWLADQFLFHVGDKLLHSKKVCPIQSDSVAAARWFQNVNNSMWWDNAEPLKFDMIFLDASHDYESVKADIQAWLPLLAPGGLLCGHDYKPTWDGVVRAVNELIPTAKKIDGDRNSIWFRPIPVIKLGA